MVVVVFVGDALQIRGSGSHGRIAPCQGHGAVVAAGNYLLQLWLLRGLKIGLVWG